MNERKSESATQFSTETRSILIRLIGQSPMLYDGSRKNPAKREEQWNNISSQVGKSGW